MTYTVIGRCARTDNLGIGITTYSLAVGATSPWAAPGHGVLSTQAFTNPDLGPVAVALLRENREPDDVLSAIAGMDGDFEYRQVGVMGWNGASAVHSGEKIRSWAGHLASDGLITMGNGLSGPHVIEAMTNAFEAKEPDDLAGRLFAALEAGRDAGGQEPSPGNRLPERSAVLLIYGLKLVPIIDLRVDFHYDAMTELRRVYELFTKYAPYYDQRHRDPMKLIPQEDWTRENMPDVS